MDVIFSYGFVRHAVAGVGTRPHRWLLRLLGYILLVKSCGAFYIIECYRPYLSMLHSLEYDVQDVTLLNTIR